MMKTNHILSKALNSIAQRPSIEPKPSRTSMPLNEPATAMFVAKQSKDPPHHQLASKVEDQVPNTPTTAIAIGVAKLLWTDDWYLHGT